ncbi:hypothetical protein GE107_24110 [Cohnella sp. CFH 77786]|uniref:TolB family protein n=1 Tax=Cohnella sp. CFH 77786 TaxID=2662265 RepID=UPI001C60EB4A|nr:hypothetical protein [Cohnella sp. CFH 77786]MBW5449118.1 hypothetical protein [Cohnella sp. CFH 77786]
MALKKMMVAASLATAVAATAGTVVFAADAAKTDLLANVDHVQWLDINRLIASQETDAGRVDYLVDVNSGKYEKLLDAQNASELAVSPDGSKAAYTDTSGAIFVLDLVAKTSKSIASNSEIKPELVWSSDGSALYFLQGDKGSLVNKLDLASGAITKVLEDKKDYKANLSVSATGKWVTYTLTVPPVVTAPSDKAVEEDAVTIDDSSAAMNVYQYDTSVSDNKAVQLSKSTDDKVFVGTDPSGAASYYIDIPAGDAKAKLVAVTAAGAEKTLFADQDVYQAKYAGGVLYALTSGPAGKNQIYAVSPTGASTLLYTVDENTTGIEVSKSGLIAIEADGKTYVEKNGQWVQVTQ